MNADIARGFPKAVHDSAQGCLVNAQHFSQTVLSDTRGVHPQLQIRIDVSIQGHGFALFFNELQRSEGKQKSWCLQEAMQSGCQSLKCLSVNILLR